MISVFRDLPAFLVSLFVHALILVVLLFVPYAIEHAAPDLSLETIFNEDREAVEYDQELAPETEVSESLSFVSGGTVSDVVGGSSVPAAAPVRVEDSTALRDPVLNPSLNDIAMPTESTIAVPLGEGDIAGETGAMVDGYGAAMHRLTQEILRMMREKKTVVVWLFDESESMRDDQREIRDAFDKVYSELRIYQEQEEKRRGRKRPTDGLQTVIASYGSTVTDRTNPVNPARSRPTADLEQIKKAIDSIPVDATGAENMCSAIEAVCRKYNNLSRTRKLAIVVVTDESGDDGVAVDAAIQAARKARAPVYVLGRESVFGFPYTRQTWTHKETGLTFPLRIRRGPETAFAECLQWDGIHERWDAFGSGFGPYEQVRLARDTGGIFFQLPGEEENLNVPGANERRRRNALVMKEYEPLLLSRRAYAEQREVRPFRKTLFAVINRLNPVENKILFANHDPKLNMRRWNFPVEPTAFQEMATTCVGQAVHSMRLVNEAIALLETVKDQRDLEESLRWRAGYDLAYAQLVMIRLRLYQYLLILDDHVSNRRTPKKPDSNEWNIVARRQPIVPDERQYERIQTTFGLQQSREEYLEVVRGEEVRATNLLRQVIATHPETPWARRARHELSMGFGHVFVENRRDPRYSTVGQQIKLPSL